MRPVIGQYYKVIKPLPYTVESTIGKILVCYKRDVRGYLFRDIETLLVLATLDEDEIRDFLEPIIFDIEPLFLKHCEEMCNKADQMRKYQPKAATYVIDSIKRGSKHQAYNALLTECDKIRHANLGDILKMYCIYI